MGTIPGYAPLLVVYLLLGVAAWMWVFSAAARPGHRHQHHQHREFRSQRAVQFAGGALITAIVILSLWSGFVDTRGVALALGLIAIAAQLILVLFFTMDRMDEAESPSEPPPDVALPEPIPIRRYVELPPKPEPSPEEVKDVGWRRRTPRRL